MLKILKSIYFLKLMFSYVDEGQKLKIIKNNKTLQNNLDISITNYKHFAGKYLIYESNGVVKGYNGSNDDLIFYCKYSEKGKEGTGEEYYEYDYGYPKFIGEYYNGKRNGEGTEFYNNRKIEFKGKYKNGKRDGHGIEYNDINGKLKFEGEYLNGKRNGKGKEYTNDGKLLFEGEYLNDKKISGIKYDNGGQIL